jgi:hypothetical protein
MAHYPDESLITERLAVFWNSRDKGYDGALTDGSVVNRDRSCARIHNDCRVRACSRHHLRWIPSRQAAKAEAKGWVGFSLKRETQMFGRMQCHTIHYHKSLVCHDRCLSLDS